jgi:glyoxylase-like metal-dependent hydrolase (beta-lactamase superfamily II)
MEQFGMARKREELAAAIRTGKLADRSPLTPEIRARKEASIATGMQFESEIEKRVRVLPNLVYRDEMTLWSGPRELRLMSVTGDATGSTVLYLPGSRILVTGDVLVSPEDGKGPPPGRQTRIRSLPGSRACAGSKRSTRSRSSRVRAPSCTTKRTCIGRSVSSRR